MSQENVEIVRRAYALFNTRHYDEWLSAFSPQIVLTVGGLFPGLDGDYRGLEGIERFLDTLFEVWDSFHAEPRELVDKGDFVGVVVDLHAVGKGSGVAVDLTFHHALHLDNGLADRWTVYPTLAEALSAIGLSE